MKNELNPGSECRRSIPTHSPGICYSRFVDKENPQTSPIALIRVSAVLTLFLDCHSGSSACAAFMAFTHATHSGLPAACAGQ